MYICMRTSLNLHKHHCLLRLQRFLSSAEISQALRPFYFSVHPDLFGRYPTQRSVNEESLKQLSAHIEALCSHRVLSTTPSVLPFFIRKEKQGDFKLVKVPLEKTANTKIVITRILQACSLSTDYIDKIKPTQTYETAYRQAQQASANRSREPETMDPTEIFQYEVNKTREEETFKAWIEKNIETSQERAKFSLELKEEVDKLKERVKTRLQLLEIKYECGWNVEHFSGCLKSLDKLADLHESDMGWLKKRILVFAPFTGISLDGHVMLFTGDVQSNWLDLFKNIPKHDIALNKIPAYEYALSNCLLKIRIRRRKFMPKTQAVEYTKHLRKVTTSILDFLSTSKYPKSWPSDLSKFKLVVESEAGPLMVSPTGQFIVPATYPGRFLVDFITTHMDEASVKLENYNKLKHIEKDLTLKCVEKLKLAELLKSESITSEEMILCLEKLLDSDFELKNLTLNITNYYSVLKDGTLNIPWDWK